MKPQFIVSDEHEEVVADLASAFEGRSELVALMLKPHELRKLDLDALYLSLPYAERWGSRPILHKAQVLETLDDDTDMPRYVITGVAMSEDEPRGPASELKLIIQAVLEAVESFNPENPIHPIRTVGFWTEMIGADRLPAKEAGKIIRAVFDSVRDKNT